MNVTPITNFVIQLQILNQLTLVFLPDLDLILEPTLIPVLTNLETEPSMLESLIPLLGNKCEFQFFDLNSIIELKPTIESKLDLSHITESVSLP